MLFGDENAKLRKELELLRQQKGTSPTQSKGMSVFEGEVAKVGLTSTQFAALMKAGGAPPKRLGEKPVSGSSAGLKEGSKDEIFVEDTQRLDRDGERTGAGPEPDANLEENPPSVGTVLLSMM